jgi:L-alanine-DL-glutamate epimerase-like enolase superfamily enzyme
MQQPLTVGKDGWIDLGDAPGMGYALDEDALARTRIG